MEYQGLQYTVVQGIARGVWKWSVSVDGMLLRGQQETRTAAVAAAEKAIDKALRLPLSWRCGLGRLNLPDASDHDPMAEGAAARLDVTLAFVSTAAIMVSLEAQAAQ
jgi:hypothetical protein